MPWCDANLLQVALQLNSLVTALVPYVSVQLPKCRMVECQLAYEAATKIVWNTEDSVYSGYWDLDGNFSKMVARYGVSAPEAKLEGSYK